MEVRIFTASVTETSTTRYTYSVCLSGHLYVYRVVEVSVYRIVEERGSLWV